MSTKKVSGVVLDCNRTLILPENIDVNFVFQCSRGFWWGEKRSNIEDKSLLADDWKQAKIVLHVRKPSLTPMRTSVSVDWDSRCYAVEKIEVSRQDNVIYIAKTG
jgi:hypothetical protein